MGNYFISQKTCWTLLRSLRISTFCCSLSWNSSLFSFSILSLEFHRFHRCHIRQIISQHPHTAQHFRFKRQIVAACAWCSNIHGREYALVGQTTVELQFLLRSFLQNYFVHFEPVSINAVAIMVKLPPFSILRAAPKKRFGLWSALASTPPERTFPDAGETVL